MDKRIEVRVQQAIEEKVFPGCVIGLVRKNGERTILPIGKSIYGPGKDVTEKTVYDLASVTKSIPLASLAAIYIAEKKVALSDTVTTYIPELRHDYGATIEDLLTYRVRGVRMSDLKNKEPEEVREYIFTHGFDAKSETSQYTNLPAFLLGEVLGRVSGESLDTMAKEYFFMPLRIRSMTFFPLDTASCAPTEMQDGVEIRGIVHDESARVFAKNKEAVGHAGLFSTARDLLTFLEALLQGAYPAVVDAAQKGLGWQVRDQNFMGQYAGLKTFGKTGFTGTSIVCDAERGIGFVILSNRTYPKRPPDQSAILAFRRDIANIILGSA